MGIRIDIFDRQVYDMRMDFENVFTITERRGS